MKGQPYMYAYVGLEPIQSPECRAADTIPTLPYTHPYVHPYILTIRYKALPPKSPYMVPYAGFGWLISHFQVLRHYQSKTLEANISVSRHVVTGSIFLPPEARYVYPPS
jgi:hypothetical protein